MKKNIVNITANKRGFTLVELTTTIAIIVILLSVISVNISDHMRRARLAASFVGQHNDLLLAAEQEGFRDDFAIAPNASGNVTGLAGRSTSDSIGGAGSGNGASVGLTDGFADENAHPLPLTNEQAMNNVFDRVIPATNESITPEQREQIVARANNIVDYSEEHNVRELENAEVATIAAHVAVGESLAASLYDESGVRGARYYTYCPATGEIALANGTGTYCEPWMGQNFLNSRLAEMCGNEGNNYGNHWSNSSQEFKDAVYANSDIYNTNIRFQLDSDFLTDEDNDYRHSYSANGRASADQRNVIYIGVNRLADGTIQVVPNVCIDANGNLNTINTPRYNNSTNDWNAYVNYIQGNTGSMLDVTTFNQYCIENNIKKNGNYLTYETLVAGDKATWQRYINALRNGWTPSVES